MSARRPQPALLLLTAVVACTAQPKPFVVYSEVKGLAGLSMDQFHRYYIPDGQCTAVLAPAVRDECMFPAKIGAVEVAVRDIVSYPRVVIAEDLNTSRVTRQAPCQGLAGVNVTLACVPGPRGPAALRTRNKAARGSPPTTVSSLMPLYENVSEK